jgi:tetratricopeptide (TPR) repeat protein
MKKFFMLMAMMVFVTLSLTAQNVFEVTDISQPNDIYSGEDNEAAVLIRCNHLIPLSFTSTMDKNVEPYMGDLQGTDSLYYIVFPTGKKYRGRELTISAPGYYSYTVALELEPKQLVSYQIVDPNSTVDAGCYRGHRNKGILEMKNANYDEARNQFELARECSDVNKEENEKNIQIIDTIMHYRRLANKSYELLDYRKSIEYYSKIVELNSYDSFASGRRDECVINFTQDCQATYDRAEYFFNNKEYDKAKELYTKVMDQKCQNYNLAVTRINEIDSRQTARKNHNTVITYEFASGDSPIGLHIGGYKMRKTGGFFEIDFNGKIFDSARGSCTYGDSPEINTSFGFTHKIANPVWFFIGPGFTFKPYYGEFEDGINPVKDVPYPDNNKKGLEQKNGEYDLTKTNVAFAVSPTIGVVVKYSYFALRLGYQYRFAFKKDLQDYIKANRFTIGIGVAF